MLLILPYILIIFLAFFGFVLAAYIYRKKRAKEALVCPLKAHCDPVVKSEYARFFGIPVELLGMLYYSLVALSYIVFVVAPAVSTPPVMFILLIITSAAFLFSLYLTFIQAFAIKQWCSWCLVSAGFSTLIFLLVATSSTLGLVPLLERNHDILMAIHLIGLALGLGGATITDLFLFRFLKDWRISAHEADVMRILSQVVWFGLAVLVMIGFGLFLPHAEELRVSTLFLIKVIVVAIIIINESFLNLVVSPRLVLISFGEEHGHRSGELKRYRRLALVLGAVSLTAWYTAFGLGMFLR